MNYEVLAVMASGVLAITLILLIMCVEGIFLNETAEKVKESKVDLAGESLKRYNPGNPRWSKVNPSAVKWINENKDKLERYNPVIDPKGVQNGFMNASHKVPKGGWVVGREGPQISYNSTPKSWAISDVRHEGSQQYRASKADNDAFLDGYNGIF